MRRESKIFTKKYRHAAVEIASALCGMFNVCVGCVILSVLDCQARRRDACSRFRIRRSIPRSTARAAFRSYNISVI